MSNDKQVYDWCIVGGGITGLACAEMLARENKSVILVEKNKKLVGSTQRVLIDVSKDNFSLGRTFRDSPTIDNYVKIEKKLDIGKFYDVDITSAQEYDLIGKVAK